MSFELNSSPSPRPCKEPKKRVNNPNIRDGLSFGDVSTAYLSGQPQTMSTSLLALPCLHQFDGVEACNTDVTHHHRHEWVCNGAVMNIINPSSASSPSSAIYSDNSTDYDSPISSSFRTSSPASSFQSVEILEPLHNMASTIKRLADRITELETRVRSLEDEVKHWKAEAEKAGTEGNENVGWFMF